MTLSYSSPETSIREALAVERSGEDVIGHVHDGWDVFGVPHGGYLTALTANAAMCASGQPDVFTVSVHFLRKASLGPLRFVARAVGGSRRLTTFTLEGRQEDRDGERVVLSAMASVGDAATLDGPAWTDRPAVTATALRDVTAGEGGSFMPPNVARRMRLQLDPETLGFAEGVTGTRAEIRGRCAMEEPSVLAALVACDLTPPAIWNALGAKGWVPTLELTAHVRQRPSPGPLHISATTRDMSRGFLEEDALVHDAEGRLVVQSRQLARWSGT